MPTGLASKNIVARFVAQWRDASLKPHRILGSGAPRDYRPLRPFESAFVSVGAVHEGTLLGFV
jgi:hypothetical protein